VLVLNFFGVFHFFEAKIQPLQQMGNSTNIADVIKVIFLIRCLKSKPKCIYLKLELTKSPSSFFYSEIKVIYFSLDFSRFLIMTFCHLIIIPQNEEKT